MNNDERFIELWNDYLEGEIDKSGVAELRELIASDARLVEMAADSYQTHRLLGLISEDSSSRQAQFIRETMARVSTASSGEFTQSGTKPSHQMRFGRQRTRFSGGAGALAAAAVALLIASIIYLWPTGEPVLAEIVAADGLVRWTGSDGRVIQEPEVGSWLGGGTLESLSADSWARIKYRDGSEVTVLGHTAVTMSARGQKELHLREGRLFAKVGPQPDKLPFLIHTPTARLEVLGTRLDVDAELASTVLNVNEGRVRVTRLADGSISEVAAEYQIVVSANPKEEFRAKLRAKAVKYWKSNLLSDASDGWVLDPKADYARLKAKPMLRKYRDAKKKLRRTLYHCALSVSRGDSSPVVLAPNGKFRVRGRATGKFEFGIVTKFTDGGFAGKYAVPLNPDGTERDGQEFDLEIDFEDFGRNDQKFPGSPVGKELVEVWCSTYDPNADLSITSVEIIPETEID